MARRSLRAAALAAALGAGASPVAAAPALQLALLEDGQGLSGLSRRSTDVAVSPDGRHVYAVSPGFTLALRREPDGTLEPIEDVYELFTPGTRVLAPRDGLGLLVLATSPGVAILVSYLRNPADGKLTFVENEQSDLAGSASAMAVSRDGELVYVTSSALDALVAYRRTAATGVLAFAQRVAESDPDATGLVDPVAVAVSPDDRHVYVAAFRRDGDDRIETIAVLRREPDDALVFVEAIDTGPLTGGPGLADLLVAPGGDEVLALDGGALGGGPPSLLRFARDADDGRLAFVAAEPLTEPGFFLGTLTWLAAWPDGRRLFFGGLALTEPTRPTGVVVAWSRAADGAIAPIVAADLGDEEAPGPVTSRGTVSPDGRFVYTNLAQGARVLVPEASGAAAAAGALAGLARRRRRPRA